MDNSMNFPSDTHNILPTWSQNTAKHWSLSCSEHAKLSHSTLLNCSRVISITVLKGTEAVRIIYQDASSKMKECWFGKYLLQYFQMHSYYLKAKSPFIEPSDFFDRVQTLRCWLILISRLVTEELFCPIAANETNELFLNVQVFHLHTLFTAVISTERETITVSTKQTDLW